MIHATPPCVREYSFIRSCYFDNVGWFDDVPDMRASYDTLFAKVKGVLGQDPYTGHLFVFINARRSSIKCLFWDGTGFVLLCKRLHEGLFYRINPMHKGEVILSAAEFALFLEGADLEKRFVESPREIKKSFPLSHDLQSASI